MPFFRRLCRSGRPWAIGICVLAVAALNGVVAYNIVEAHAEQAPLAGLSAMTLRSSKPVVLPPVPGTSVAAATPAPAPQADPPVQGQGVGQGVAVVRAVAATVNAAPSNIVDPSEVVTAIGRSLPLYEYPGAPAPYSSLPNPIFLSAPLVLLVTGLEPGWVQAYIPVRPNESTAWFPASDVTFSSVPCHIVVSLSARQLVYYCNNAPVFSSTVAPGAPDSPTPTGSYFVSYIVRLTDPSGPYGPWALGLSAFSNTYYSFDGGPGQIGIHGTDQPWVIGTYASHGCVRLPNSEIAQLAPMVLPGTPVEIGP